MGNHQKQDLNELLKQLPFKPPFLDPIPEPYVNEFNLDYQKTFYQIKFKDKFVIDLYHFMMSMKESQNEFMNFCLVDNSNLSFMLHFSNRKEFDLQNDSIYLLTEESGLLHFKRNDNPETYKKLTESYKAGLGKIINEITGISNTTIVIYNYWDVVNFLHDLQKELIAYGGLNSIKYLQFDMMIYPKTHSDERIRKHPRNITFAVRAFYENNAKAIKPTGSYNFGQLHP